ncbi:hypothetical protein SD074_05180 [Prolixibacter sp. SD074]|nr:hypothetical protein SD074_05180 [Prolixibacter sp. SD074]
MQNNPSTRHTHENDLANDIQVVLRGKENKGHNILCNYNLIAQDILARLKYENSLFTLIEIDKF